MPHSLADFRDRRVRFDDECRRRSGLGRIGLVLAFSMFLSSAGQAGQPVKLAVDADARQTDGTAAVTVSLRDADNRPATAPREMAVAVTARMPDGSVVQNKVVIPAGQGLGKLDLSLPKGGIVEVRASQPELMEGGTFLRLRTRPAVPTTPAALATTVQPADQPQPVATAPGEARRPVAETPERHTLPRPLLRATRSPTPAVAAPPAAVPAPAPAARPVVALRYSPQGRALLADGKDSATISAFLLADEPAPRDIQIRLFSSHGELKPATALVIRRGEDSAQVRLSSAQVGTAAVEYLGASPAAEITGDSKMLIAFAPPISSLDVSASPRDISLMEQCDLVVRLSDASGRPVATDVARTVSLTLENGHGTLAAKELTIPAGSSEGRTRFVPAGLGMARLSAFSPGLMKSSSEVRIGMPFLLLGASALGALAGGLLAFVKEGRRNPWRLLVGLITGFLLYLSAAFLNIMPEFTFGDFHPFAVLLVSAVGGWLGTKIFDPLVKRLGLGGQAP